MDSREGTSSCLFWTELILTGVGLRRDVSSFPMKLVNYCCLFVAIFRAATGTFLDMYDIAVKGFTVYRFADIGYYLFFWTWMLSMIVKRHQHLSFMRKTLDSLGMDDFDHIRHASRKAALVFAVYLIVHLLCFLPILSPNRSWIMARIFFKRKERPVAMIALANVAHAYEGYVTSLWMVNGMSLYSMAHLIKHRMYLKSLRQIRDGKRGHSNGNEIMQSVTKMDMHFTSAFSLFPFLIMATNFFLSAGYLISQFDPELAQQKQIDRYQLITLSLAFLSVPLVLISTVSRRREELSKVRYKLIDHLHQQENKTQADVTLIETIVRSMEKDTVWRMTSIDWSLVTAYLGYLLSFAVLFTQLLPKDRK